MLFNDLVINNLKSKAKRYVVTETGVPSDCRGLQMLVYPGRCKTWRFRYTKNGKTRVVRLGNFPSMSTKDARAKADEIRSAVKNGEIVTSTTPVANNGPMLLLELIELFEKEHCLALVQNGDGEWVAHPNKRPLSSARQIRWALDKHIIPYMGTKDITKITRRDAIIRVKQIVADGSAAAAINIAGLLNRLFSFAENEELVEANVMQGLSKLGGAKQFRTRVLTNDEIRTFWAAVEGLKNPQGAHNPMLGKPEYLLRLSAVFKLLLLTGCRESEITDATWREIDLEERTFTISGERIKNRKEHVVPLSDFAMEVLKEVSESQFGDVVGGMKRYVFPSTMRAGIPIHRNVVSHRATLIGRANNIEDFVCHDLRRTFRTRLSELGVDERVAEKCVNHSLSGMLRVYDQHDYYDEKRDAFQKWADYLRRILDEEDSIVQIHAAAS